ncbi:efflux pump antibiotic resistance protein [Mycena metata]|uniref:Efflux pump antibiotic resistance protein n=1 Tax=Mycena metata TaxID=1033252 RepID=A0AAD7IXR8_9AGAR|nr:efflux pump antibiotic resistance protein [Mycena metata]
MPPSSQSVDPSSQRTVPMQVLALGFSRTGTASLKIALEELGYVRTEHGFAVWSSPAKIDMWTRAIQAKVSGASPYGRAEWDQLLGDCMAVTDSPCIIFSEELIKAYPEAKVVLTNRSLDSWWKSYEATLVAERKAFLLNSWLNGKQHGTFGRLLFVGMFGTEQVTEEIAKARYLAHYEAIRRLVPKNRLLEYDVKEGWEPLAAFLEKEAPATAFPSVNTKEDILQYFATLRRALLWRWTKKLAGPLAIMALAVCMYRRA